MTTSKLYSIAIAMSICCFMVIGNKPSRASTPRERALLNRVTKVLEAVKAVSKNKTYFENKDSSHIASFDLYIKDKEQQKQVMDICDATCTEKNCKTQKAMKAQCQKLCPERRILGCLVAASTPLEKVNLALSLVSQNKKYLKTKAYGLLEDFEPMLMDKVEGICRDTCTEKNCKTQAMQTQCQKLCPAKDIPGCFDFNNIASPLEKVNLALSLVPEQYLENLKTKNDDIDIMRDTDIKSDKLIDDVINICYDTCTEQNCKNQAMKTQCQKLCPKMDIPRCLAAQVQKGDQGVK